MVIQKKYSFLIKKWNTLLYCLLASVSSISAQSFIVKQPQDITVCASDYTIVVLDIEVVGNVNDYDFQWRILEGTGTNWVNISQATSYSYQAEKAAKYMCVVRKISNSETQNSDIATVTIQKPPSISIKGIQTLDACYGGDFTASLIDPVTTYGYPLTEYVWYLVPDVSKRYSGVPVNNVIPNQTFTNMTIAQNVRLIVRNSCGADSVTKYVHVWDPPRKPTPIAKNYCQGETPVQLAISEASYKNIPVWYNASMVELTTPPTPDTSTPNTTTWWVKQKEIHGQYLEGPVCESDITEVTVIVYSTPTPPVVTDVTLCLGDPGITLDAQGVYDIAWWDDRKNSISQAPSIGTSEVKTINNPIIYYASQYYITPTNQRCESRIDDGKITVLVRDISSLANIELSYNPESCPNRTTIIEASSQTTNPIFRWYLYNDKTGVIPPGSIENQLRSSILTTSPLMRDTAYYVTIEYGGLCESLTARSVVINVRDIVAPYVAFEERTDTKKYENIVVSANDGICYATNVQLGAPAMSDDCTQFSDLKVTVLKDDSFPITDATEYMVGDHQLTWWVEDEAGNKYSAVQNVSVRDMEKPRGTCPADILKEIDETESSVVVNYNLDYTDNCTAASNLEDLLYRGLPSGSSFELGETQIIRYIIDEAGNTDTCSFKVIVKHPYRVMEVDLRLSANPICPGQEVVLTPVISGGTGRNTYSWKPRAWTDPVMRDYPFKNTTYEVIVSDGLTTETKTADVTVLETRQVYLTLEGRTMDEIFEGDEVLVTATSGFDSYKLMLNHEVIQEAGEYHSVSFQAELGSFIVMVFATDENYCVTQDQMLIEVDSRKLPNVFTPNFDGKNDKFLEFLEKSDAPKDFQLEIFNRAGKLLYQGNKGWDGIYKGKVLPQGTYLYVARRKMNNGEYRTFKGNVTLKM